MTERLHARTPRLSWRDVRALSQRWSAEIASHPGYMQVEGRPMLSILNVSDFEREYGLTALQVVLRVFRGAAREQSGIEPFLIGVIGQADIRNAAICNALPIDGVSGYGLLPNWLCEPVQDYGELIRQRITDWEELQGRLDVPFFPVVCCGWDASVRGAPQVPLTGAEGYPHSPIVTGMTVDEFRHFLEAARAFNRRHAPRPPLVFLHAWNEWTEGSVLEPSDRHRTALLDVILSAHAGETREVAGLRLGLHPS